MFLFSVTCWALGASVILTLHFYIYHFLSQYEGYLSITPPENIQQNAVLHGNPLFSSSLFFFFRGTISDNLDLLCLFLQFVTDLLFLESVMFVLGVVWRN